MTPDQFSELASQGFNHIPINRELFADLDTPLSCYIKVARGPYSYLLETGRDAKTRSNSSRNFNRSLDTQTCRSCPFTQVDW